jgi:probable phosphoglycerate mutase
VTSTEVRQLRFEPPPESTTIYLVRHGETIPAREDAPFELVDGHGDPALHERGVVQAQQVAGRLGEGAVGKSISAIYVTSLKRTAETAAPLAARLGLDPIVEADLREVYLGEWEGGLYRIKMLENGPIVQEMMDKQRWDVIPGAEPDEDLTTRVKGAIDRIAAAHPGETVVAFTHGGVIGRVMAEASSSRPFAFLGADNGSISELVVVGGRWIVRSYNDRAHLTA